MAVYGAARVTNATVAQITLGSILYDAVRFDVDVICQGEINLKNLMVAIAASVPTAVTRNTYSYPEQNPAIPAAVVSYPESIDFDMTMGRGSDRAVFPLYFVCGAAHTVAARDALSAILTGVNGIKNAIDGTLEV